METITAISGYYARGGEVDRLNVGRGRLEFLRTLDVLRRILPARPARVLDVGGGAGVHARWLAADGYQVRLVDPMPLHVQHAAAIAGVDAVLGDARRLDEPDAAYQATLLLGPLYHLPERRDRVTALREAARVTAPGGLVAAAGGRASVFAYARTESWTGGWSDPYSSMGGAGRRNPSRVITRSRGCARLPQP